MNVLVLNAGSSTLKFQLVRTDEERMLKATDERLARGQYERIGGETIYSISTPDASPVRGTAPLREPLSDRETGVLRCLPTMLSNQEIASELFISVNTLKTHLKQIYRKLDATSRREAVERARDLYLISPGH